MLNDFFYFCAYLFYYILLKHCVHSSKRARVCVRVRAHIYNAVQINLIIVCTNSCLKFFHMWIELKRSANDFNTYEMGAEKFSVQARREWPPATKWTSITQFTWHIVCQFSVTLQKINFDVWSLKYYSATAIPPYPSKFSPFQAPFETWKQEIKKGVGTSV